MSTISFIPSIHNPGLQSGENVIFNDTVQRMCNHAKGYAEKILNPHRASDYDPQSYYAGTPIFFMGGPSYGSRSTGISGGDRILLFAGAAIVSAFVVSFIAQFTREARQCVKEEKVIDKVRGELLPESAPKDHMHVKMVKELSDLQKKLNDHQKSRALFKRALAITAAVGAVLIMLGALFGSPLPLLLGILLVGVSVITYTISAIINACRLPHEKMAEEIQEKANEILNLTKKPTETITN